MRCFAASGVLILALSGCGDDDGEAGAGASSPGGAGPTSGPGPGSGGSGPGSSGPGSGGSGASVEGPGISVNYPGDVGIENDPAVVWHEPFEGAVAGVAARYEEAANTAGMALVADRPGPSSGATSMRFRAGGGNAATHLFKNLAPGYDQLYLRYYVKYDGAAYHHTGAWLGGYNPASNWPMPGAGTRPSGNDRFSVALEPMGGGETPRLDFYNYWMRMRSWEADQGSASSFYGNTKIHQQALRSTDDWMCFEIKIRLNPDPSSGAGAELALWLEDQSVIHFTDSAPTGTWIRDKFCPAGADTPDCTDYQPETGVMPLDLQYRNSTDLRINAFWPQNYISNGPEGDVYFDDVVIATERVGCIK